MKNKMFSGKLTGQLLFKIRFPNNGVMYGRQVVNPWHQTSQGQSVVTGGLPVSYPNWEYKFDIKEPDVNMFNPLF